ncbi:conserved hypothetical protein [Hyphomicrobiales bacterium]|nr:conserved hypothetical protein [Hyphomicrobiales bacterium]CAH1667580.1 conserved hypothetical protein [Hyphomicrobiales bacterium]
MDEQKPPTERMADLPDETRAFLAQLQPGDIELLREGLGLLRSILTVGRFMRWLVITLAGLVIGSVMLWENIQKAGAWLKSMR